MRGSTRGHAPGAGAAGAARRPGGARRGAVAVASGAPSRGLAAALSLALVLGLACASGGARPPAAPAGPVRASGPLDPVAQQIAALPGAEVAAQGGVVTVTWPADLLFEDGQPSLRPGGEEALRGFAARVAGYGDPVLRVKAHTDVDGSESYSLGLSEDRAERVRAMLVEAGLSPVRVAAAGFGGEFPVAGNDTEEGRARNRRLEIEIHPAGAVQIAPAAPELR